MSINLIEHKQKMLESYGAGAKGTCSYSVNWSSKYLNDAKRYESVLDVGCGDGSFCLQCATSGGKIQKVYGLDPASIANGHVKAHNKITYLDSWSHEIPLPDKSVDIIVTCEVLEHVPEEFVHKTLQEFQRVTKCKIYGQIATRLSGEWYSGYRGDGDHKGQVNAHLCVKDQGWWLDRFKRAGLKIDSAQENLGQGFSFVASV
ncbi:hypothetical protein CMI37_22175 [Candidatus Pacearchaeota archaeon]|nr:hypothetical protein [Candidatus Pacearchaeota archaeon]|tara:strand:+ start:15192 stop:15800 length:609 start_codon:yes stop_codon:yes gene_type:complete